MQSEKKESNAGGVVLVTSDRFGEHVTPDGHPERLERFQVMQEVALRWERDGGQVVRPTTASTPDLARVHSGQHIDRLGATAGRTVRLDPDTWTSPESEAVARLAAGAVLVAVDHAIERRHPAVAFVRPPGHHAERDRAMGFCLYNNIAVAAAYARYCGLEQIAIVDYDVHHGNGTQWMFYDDPNVLFVSMHQYPFYPGTGAADDVGVDAGSGYTVNIPLAAGAGDADYDLVFQQVVLPVLDAYGPDMVLLSAGYDAHDRDPLGGMAVTTEGYTRMTTMLRQYVDRRCDGRMAAVTEGGYDLTALEECLTETLRVLSDPSPRLRGTVEGPTDVAQASVASVRRAQAGFWTL